MILVVNFELRHTDGKTILSCRECTEPVVGSLFTLEAKFENDNELRQKLAEAWLPREIAVNPTRLREWPVTDLQLKMLGFVLPWPER